MTIVAQTNDLPEIDIGGGNLFHSATYNHLYSIVAAVQMIIDGRSMMNVSTIISKSKYFLIIGLVVLSVGSAFIVREILSTKVIEPTEFTWPGAPQIGRYYESIQNLEANANNIFLAMVVGTRDGETAAGDTEVVRRFYKMFDLEIIEVYKGMLQPGDVVELMQMTQSRSYFIREENRDYYRTIPLAHGNEYILFTRSVSVLNRHNPHPNEPQLLLNSWQAAYRVDRKATIVQDAFGLSNVDERNDLVLTVYDLRAIQER
ncbi:MAG: hypothetical protein FWC75_02945 [Oscillospiraceae bacterium]|nr:hypothetical protein [Oscillospiraceae bacterium]